MDKAFFCGNGVAFRRVHSLANHGDTGMAADLWRELNRSLMQGSGISFPMEFTKRAPTLFGIVRVERQARSN